MSLTPMVGGGGVRLYARCTSERGSQRQLVPEHTVSSAQVNRYKLHLAAVKSLVPEKLHRTANLNDEV